MCRFENLLLQTNVGRCPHFELPWKLRLPPEIIDRILDCLRGDKRTLCHCALVCHAWHSRSQYNLFYSMVITNEKVLKSLVAMSKTPHLVNYFKSVHEVTICDLMKVCW
ncbi:hypothetical protein B0H21DRAFT_686016 [Amylocystis lapponica]|nr:hypothetical protein B0H21DRAFT_686016 [Amylocystis lapponica]